MKELQKDSVAKLNVLIIEDNLDECEFFVNYLHQTKQRNIEHKSCTSLACGLEVIAKGWAEIVFLDLASPQSLGIDSIKKIHELDSTVPIVNLTSVDDEDLALDAISAGAQDYLVKGTLTPSVLGRSITYALERQRSASINKRLDLAVRAARLGQWSWDSQANSISWDAGMYELFGLAENHFVPTMKRFLKCVHTDDRDFVKKSLSKTGSLDFDFRVVWPDASIHNIALKGDGLRDESRQPRQIAGVCFDISEQKAAEKALQASEQRLRLALESAKMGVWDWDASGFTISRSPLHDFIYGYETALEEWSYETFLSRVMPEDLDHVKQTIDAGVPDGRFALECRIIHVGDGSVRWVSILGETVTNENGMPTRLIGTIKDVTESKQLEKLAQDVQESRELTLHAIVQYAPIGIVILDSELNVIDTNAAFNSLLGRNLSEMVGQPLSAILPCEAIQSAQQNTKQGKPVQIAKLEMRLAHQQGRKNYWNLSLWPILRAGGVMSGAVLQVIDCTQTVLLERQRDDFLAAVAHDIKNPLIGAARILDVMCNQSEMPSKENQIIFLNALRESNQTLLSLVQNLVDICRYETLVYPCYIESIVVSKLFEDCIQQLAHFAENNNVSMDQDVTDPGDTLLADQLGIKRVLTNLLHNAIKFNKAGGKVTVSFDQTDEEFNRISVTDTGDGISESDQLLLFQRFAQGTEGRRFATGTGLGLYLSKQIIEAHHGHLTCESVVGKGSTFVIAIPKRVPLACVNEESN